MDKLRLPIMFLILVTAFGPVEAAVQASVSTAKPGKATVVAKTLPAPTPSASPAQPAAVPEAAKAEPAYQQYSYYGDRYRDPFIPLTAEYHADQTADRPPQI